MNLILFSPIIDWLQYEFFLNTFHHFLLKGFTGKNLGPADNRINNNSSLNQWRRHKYGAVSHTRNGQIANLSKDQ